MIKMLNAFTEEVDEAEAALADILAQIDLSALKKNSVGILSCYSEFIESGIAAKLCDALPFDVVGVTTMACGSSGGYGMYGLNLAVLTSDDVVFRTSLSAPLSPSGYAQLLTDAYTSARQTLPGEPSLILSFFPLAADLSVAVFLDHLNKLCNGAPIFGTLSSDVALTQTNCKTFLNGESDARAAAFILMHGEVNPKFVVSSLPDKNVSTQKALVTESDGCILKKVNGVPLLEYLKESGFLSRAETGLFAVDAPIMVDYGNGSKPVALRVYNVFENGDALCGGEIPVGAYLSLGQVDHDGIIGTAEAALAQISGVEGANGFLMYPCVSRYMMLSPDKDEEIRKVIGTVGESQPYVITYSGGEICPVYGEDGKTYNRFHNYTCVACVF